MIDKCTLDILTTDATATDTVCRIALTRHARDRMAQRNFTAAEIDYILQHGSWYAEGSDDACILRQRDVPRDEWAAFGYLAGTKIALAGGAVKTLYRNRVRLS